MDNYDMPVALREMPRYVSHKQVHALKLRRIEVTRMGDLVMHPEDEAYEATPVVATEALHAHLGRALVDHPDDPGYLVVYADGYRSWSPTKAFEEGYTPAA